MPAEVRTVVAACILGVSSLSACGSAPPRLPPQVQLTVANRSPAPVCSVHIRRSSAAAAGWGTDWLDRDEFVAPGLSRTFHLPQGERWDLRLDGCDGRELLRRDGIVLDRDDTVVFQAP